MENLRKVYDLNTKYILGGNNNFLRNLREELIENFVFDNNIKKNNESLKHIVPTVLNELNFNTNNEELNFEYLNDDNSDSSLVVKNGSHFSLMNKLTSGLFRYLLSILIPRRFQKIDSSLANNMQCLAKNHCHFHRDEVF